MYFSTLHPMPILADIIIFYVFYRFCKWLLKPFVSPSPLRDIPGPPSQSWFTGNLGQLFNAKGLPFHQEIVDRYGGMVKIHGFFGDEQLYISDPRALQHIVIKDQDSFEETAVFTETNKVIFGPGLVATTGDQHKRQRKAVTPVFSVSQLRQITPVLYDVAFKLCDVLEHEAEQSTVLDMSEWMCRVALETVGRTVLGYSFDPLDSPHNNPYTSAIKELIPTLFRLALVRQFAPFLSKLGPAWFRRKLVEWTPVESVQRVKDMSDVMHETAVKILKEKREKIKLEGGSVKSEKDIISVLLRENQRADDALSDNELTGQMTVLIFGAQDTTSSALSRILFLLAGRPDIQSKLREEISEATNKWEGGKGTYDDIMALPWLDAVIKETLRLYPPVPFVRRTTTKTTTLPYTHPSSPGSSLPLSNHSVEENVLVPKGTTLFVSIAGSNRLESVWGADAKTWRPERWLERGTGEKPNEGARLPGVYAGMMSFFGGGRSCVGYKFAQVEMKIILLTLLSRFEFSGTKEEIVWNLSQIISPSVRDSEGEKKGMPLFVRRLARE